MNRKSLTMMTCVALLSATPYARADQAAAPTPQAAAPPPASVVTPSVPPPPTTAKPSDTASAIDPNAKSVINNMTAAYQALKSFSDTEELTGGGLSLHASVSVKKPGQARVEATVDKVTKGIDSDAKFVYIYTSSNPKEYLKVAVPAGQNSILAVFAMATQQEVLEPTSLILAGDDLLAEVEANIKKLNLLPASQIDGTKVDVVQMVLGTTSENTRTFIFEIGQSDHLLRRVTFSGVKSPTVVETHTHIKLNESFSSQQFAFVPPAGAKAIQQGQPSEEAYYDKRLKTGTTPFPIKAQDLDGKSVTLDQFRGKVLLVDFWATWCGPCNYEIPNVVFAYDKYHDKGFEILGVTMDENPDKKKFQDFLKSHHMTWRQVYQQPDVIRTYGVQAIPFTLLIGKDGKIAAVEPRGPLLAQAIEKELSKK